MKPRPRHCAANSTRSWESSAEIGRKIARILHTYQNGNSVDLHFFLIERYENELQNRIFREIRWVNGRLPALDFLDADKELVRQLASGDLL